MIKQNVLLDKINACRHKRRRVGTFYECTAGDFGDITIIGNNGVAKLIKKRCEFYLECYNSSVCWWWRLGGTCACDEAKANARIISKNKRLNAMKKEGMGI